MIDPDETWQDFNEMEQRRSHVTYDDLLQGLWKLGISPGDHLVVHLALSVLVMLKVG